MREPQLCNVACRLILDEKAAKEFKEEDEEHVMEEARELRRGARPKIPNSKLKDFYWHKE